MIKINTYKEENRKILSEYRPNGIIKDGIVSPADYIKSEIKVMFVNREPNDKDEEYDLSEKIGEALDNKMRPFGDCRIFTESIKSDLVLASCLKNLYITKEELQEKIDNLSYEEFASMLKASAVCNVKKTGGEGTVDWEKMFIEYDENNSVILKQIVYYNPTIIFSGNLVDKLLERDSANFEWSELDIQGEKYKFYITEMQIGDKKYLLLDLYHPSYPWLYKNVDYWYEILRKLRDQNIDIQYHINRSLE